MIWIAAYLLSGALVGLLAGLLGLGGGMTLVPILSALFSAQSLAPGYIVHLALGTGMASMVFTSFASVREHHRLGSVDWPVARRMVPGILLGSFAASAASGWFSQRTLAIAYGVIAVVGAAQLLRSPRGCHCVVAGAASRNAACALCGIQIQQGVDGAARLERACALEEFELHFHHSARTETRGQRAVLPAPRGGLDDPGSDLRAHPLEFGEAEFRVHGASPR